MEREAALDVLEEESVPCWEGQVWRPDAGVLDVLGKRRRPL